MTVDLDRLEAECGDGSLDDGPVPPTVTCRDLRNVIAEARRTDQLERALRQLRLHSLLQVRRAAFAAPIGARYSEQIRSEIGNEIWRMEQVIDDALRGEERERPPLTARWPESPCPPWESLR